MQTELKNAIIKAVQDNADEYQLTNFITDKFRPYIYTPKGEYLVGGESVGQFIRDFINMYIKCY